MQVDMHYYCVYCIARIAGFNKKAAQTIAYSSQYVDDSNNTISYTHKNGGKTISALTAHHPINIRNLDSDNQRNIWIPFHFFPGGEGKYFTEKLICRKDSQLINRVLDHYITLDKPYELELLGIAMHVYMDTFAHYGFSGVSSRRNRIISNSLVLHNDTTAGIKLERIVRKWFRKYGEQGQLLENIRSIISEGIELTTGALGHGGCSIYPDLPYLKWEFEYEYTTPTLEEEIAVHDNPATYLEACQKVFHIFRRFLKTHPQYEDLRPSGKIEKFLSNYEEILAFEGDKHERSLKWREYARKRDTLFAGGGENIPFYSSDKWEKNYAHFEKISDLKDFPSASVFKFIQAANYHHNYTLREFLPQYGIIVI